MHNKISKKTMWKSKMKIKNKVLQTGTLLCSLLAAGLVNASPVTMEGQAVKPMIGAGTSSDYGSGGAPFVQAGEFTGVVSIEIVRDGGVYICTGSAISSRHIITAAHCIERNDGSIMDLSAGTVSAVFSDGGNFVDYIPSSSVVAHPDYLGFAVCSASDGAGFSGVCLNDDIAILTLEEDIPAGVEIYDFYTGDVDSGDIFTMVGYGTTGNGYDGYTGSPDWTNKRYGFNIPEIFDCDDASIAPDRSGGYASSAACPAVFGSEAEVWYADFDGYFTGEINGTMYTDVLVDRFCALYGIGCGAFFDSDTTTGLFEATIGGGDSGGPSFIYDSTNDKFLLAANNTFGANTSPIADGAFGDRFGGNLYAPYLDWINSITNANAPATLAILLSGLGIMVVRRRKAK
ncbi:trypsin-like serine protease [Alteromonas oceani]|uniref:Trypsin-like serine protease n=1 Tax=Alteromonas oceani TaxID=2071609 RepID=A0ABV7JXW7_9ALTE|nr:trypsin-like serine protease [Alteromonas oceani]